MQVSQGHLSVAVHEPLCCALIRALHARATPLWAADRSSHMGTAPRDWDLENRASAGSGEVWLSLRSTEERDRIA
jgi:hypothetical protein